jgi:hypothetical protein
MDTGETYDELLPLLLQICEDFFAATNSATHRELDALLRSRDITGGPGWLIDMLALTRTRLESTANTADHAPGRAPDAR